MSESGTARMDDPEGGREDSYFRVKTLKGRGSSAHGCRNSGEGKWAREDYKNPPISPAHFFVARPHPAGRASIRAGMRQEKLSREQAS